MALLAIRGQSFFGPLRPLFGADVAKQPSFFGRTRRRYSLAEAHFEGYRRFKSPSLQQAVSCVRHSLAACIKCGPFAGLSDQ
jgi:hypothetical protein